jgi:hypothetical protein
MRNIKDVFKKAIDDAYTKQTNIKLNSNIVGDALKYQQDMKQELRLLVSIRHHYLQKKKLKKVKNSKVA